MVCNALHFFATCTQQDDASNICHDCRTTLRQAAVKLRLCNPMLFNFCVYLSLSRKVAPKEIRELAASCRNLFIAHFKEVAQLFVNFDYYMAQDAYDYWESFSSVLKGKFPATMKHWETRQALCSPVEIGIAPTFFLRTNSPLTATKRMLHPSDSLLVF